MPSTAACAYHWGVHCVFLQGQAQIVVFVFYFLLFFCHMFCPHDLIFCPNAHLILATLGKMERMEKKIFKKDVFRVDTPSLRGSACTSGMDTGCLPPLPPLFVCGQYAGIVYDAEDQHVSVHIASKFMYAVHPPPEPEIHPEQAPEQYQDLDVQEEQGQQPSRSPPQGLQKKNSKHLETWNLRASI